MIWNLGLAIMTREPRANRLRPDPPIDPVDSLNLPTMENDHASVPFSNPEPWPPYMKAAAISKESDCIEH